MAEKRTKIKDNVTRSKFIKIRVTVQEQEQFRMMAVDRGVTVSKMIVDLLKDSAK